MSAKQDLKRFISNLEKNLKTTVTQQAMKQVGNEAIRLIVTRTRLGYGVTEQGNKQRLKPLSAKYVEHRKKKNLHGFTTPSRSNLTFTGQMLDSMQIIKVEPGRVIIGPRGYRSDGLSNEFVANVVAKSGRPFNNISTQEQSQLLRFFRRIFGDLVDRKF